MKSELFSSDQHTFEAEILEKLFTGFTSKQVRYAVLRNYEMLPQSIGARDIDIVVHADDLATACQIVITIAQDRCLRYANHYADERLTQFALVTRNSAGGLQQIKIDFFVRSEVYGIELFSAEEMLADIRIHNGIAVVADHILLLDKWLFHLLVGRPLHAKYDAKFAAIARDANLALTNNLSRFLCGERATALVAALANGSGSSLVLTKWERRFALSRLWWAQGARAVQRSIRFAGFRLREMLRPHGIFLSVSGPDGCGKTTVINLVNAQLRAIWGDNAVHYAHFRPTSLPRIAELAKKAYALDNVDVRYDIPHRAKPSGLLGSTFRLSYYALDYIAGYFRSIRPALCRREIILYDRYYFDMIADCTRSRISLPTPILRFVGLVLPLPRYAFFLNVDSEKVHHRKQELAKERIVELNDRYKDLVNRGWLISIDNNFSPSRAATAIVDCIVLSEHSRVSKNAREVV